MWDGGLLPAPLPVELGRAPWLHVPLLQTSVEEMIASTAYLDLFLRSVSETALLKTFLRFVLLHRHDNMTILDTLVGRINSNSRVSPVAPMAPQHRHPYPQHPHPPHPHLYPSAISLSRPIPSPSPVLPWGGWHCPLPALLPV